MTLPCYAININSPLLKISQGFPNRLFWVENGFVFGHIPQVVFCNFYFCLEMAVCFVWLKREDAVS
jgi:hypothetical protein